MHTPAERTPQTIVETRRLWVDMHRQERRLRVLELMQARNTTQGIEALADLLIAYMTHDKKRPSPHTERVYRRAVANLFSYWHDYELRANDNTTRTWEHPGADAGKDYKAHLLDDIEDGGRGLTAGSARVELAAVSRFYAALRWCNFTKSDPWLDVSLPQNETKPEDQRAAYSPRDIEQLRMKAEELRDAAHKREEAARWHIDLLVVLLGAHGGLRASEMVGIRWGDLHLNDDMPTLMIPGEIQRAGRTVRVAKNLKGRRVGLTPALVQALRAVDRTDNRPEVLPFNTTSRLYRRFARLAELAGIDGGAAGRGVHGLRHSCATRIYQQTGDLGQARQQLGHASISTTQRYAKADMSRVAATLASWV